MGFTGCVSVDYFNAYGTYLGSSPATQADTTGINGARRTVSWYAEYWTAQQTHRLQINHWHCPKS